MNPRHKYGLSNAKKLIVMLSLIVLLSLNGFAAQGAITTQSGSDNSKLSLMRCSDQIDISYYAKSIMNKTQIYCQIQESTSFYGKIETSYKTLRKIDSNHFFGIVRTDNPLIGVACTDTNTSIAAFSFSNSTSVNIPSKYEFFTFSNPINTLSSCQPTY